MFSLCILQMLSYVCFSYVCPYVLPLRWFTMCFHMFVSYGCSYVFFFLYCVYNVVSCVFFYMCKQIGNTEYENTLEIIIEKTLLCVYIMCVICVPPYGLSCIVFTCVLLCVVMCAVLFYVCLCSYVDTYVFPYVLPYVCYMRKNI